MRALLLSNKFITKNLLDNIFQYNNRKATRTGEIYTS